MQFLQIPKHTLTKNDELRENIIAYSQHVFNEKLLKMPSEFIVNYIQRNCPIIEKPYSLYTDSHIGDIWSDICNDKRKSIKFDKDYIVNRTKFIRQVYKKLDLIINRVTLNIYINDEIFYNQQVIKPIYDKLTEQYGFFDSDDQRIIKISILFVFYLLCNCVELDSSAYDKFWMNVGIKRPIDRLWYMFNHHKEIFTRGPFYLMSMMAFIQIMSGQKSNRGLVLDCMHVSYITYLDRFITNDSHFKIFSEYYSHSNMYKILFLDDAKITKKEISIIKDI